MQRRQILKAAMGIALAGIARGDEGEPDTFTDKLRAIEKGGRLGVQVLCADGTTIGYRSDERFALCSTFKLPLAAMILREADLGRLDLDTAVRFGEEDMVPYAPVTGRHLERGSMTVRDLAEAAQTTSDNVAANLLLELIDGPAGFTERLREFGDDVTRLDRMEPELNIVPPGEVRDTTTPSAMANLVTTILSADVLRAGSLETLKTWLVATTTGKRRLKAGLPEGWRVGNKTGTGIAPGMANQYNDVAVAWPEPGAAPWIIAAYFQADGEYDRIRAEDEAVLRRVAALATA